MGHDPDTSHYEVNVVVTDQDQALLTLASVLHRRGRAVRSAQLWPIDCDRLGFTATFLANERQATTVARTLEGVIGVLDVHLSTLKVAA